MTITYIFHSCFAIETDQSLLIFDYWLDPGRIMENLLTTDKNVYFFASHFHEDHFNKTIFSFRNNSRSFTYILSKDILKRGRASKSDADVWLAKGGTWHDDNVHVIASGSNDSGVSWIIETEGYRFFHAGDLCNWYARFLAEDNIPETICSEEFGLINPICEEKRFLGELKDVARLLKDNSSATPHDKALDFDFVLFPVDGRIGNGYTLGGRQFIERFKVGLFIPMHFVASGFESAWRMEPFCIEKNTSFWCISSEGEKVSFIDSLVIRNTTVADVPRLKEVFSAARKFMSDTGNPHQWAETYPSDELLHNDIDSGDSYVCVIKGQIVATFVLRGGVDPTYNKIYDGRWLNDNPYATIHRIASAGIVRGIFGQVLAFAHGLYDTIRIDTHRDNKVMQTLLDKHGFKYCGIIHCWNGDERLAYIL